MNDNKQRKIVLTIELVDDDINVVSFLPKNDYRPLEQREKTLLLIALHELKNKIQNNSLIEKG